MCAMIVLPEMIRSSEDLPRGTIAVLGPLHFRASLWPTTYGWTASGCPLSLSRHVHTKEKRTMSTSTTATESKTNPRRIFEDAAA
jgi:hypothetical protein